MKRILLTTAVLVAAAAFVVLAGGAGKNQGTTYWVELDNAFGLISGADVKIAGTKAGKIGKLKVEAANHKALVEMKFDPGPYSRLRRDAFCESKPQSLIGEYFLDCSPGHQRVLKDGSTIRVAHTSSTIAPDLVNNILRLPYRERLRLIINELGAGVAGGGEALNEALRRAVPALRETDNVLAILARQNQVLANLVTNGDAALKPLADNRRNVGRFVGEARDTARISATRKAALAATFRKLPAFLAQLRPTMAELGRVADRQTPALRNLSATSRQLTRFFNDLGPFSNASRTSLRSLGDAAVVGRQAVRSATPTVAELRKFAKNTPELGKNLAIILEDLDNRDRAVEKDARSPGGKGYTGLEALLQYIFDQGQAINVFDQNGFILKVSVRGGDCAAYRTAATIKSNAKVPGTNKTGPELYAECKSILGPSQPGINQPDPSRPVTAAAAKAQKNALIDQSKEANALDAGRRAAQGTPGGSGSGPGNRAPSSGNSSGAGNGRPPIDLSSTLGAILGRRPKTPIVPAPALPGRRPLDGESTGQLLDYLLAP